MGDINIQYRNGDSAELEMTPEQRKEAIVRYHEKKKREEKEKKIDGILATITMIAILTALGLIAISPWL